MIRQIAPVLFTKEIPATLAYYKDKLGFDVLGPGSIPRSTPSCRATSTRSTCAAPIHQRPIRDKYADELLEAYLSIEDADVLHAEYAATGVEFSRELANTPWGTPEFVVKDSDGRLLALGSNL